MRALDTRHSAEPPPTFGWALILENARTTLQAGQFFEEERWNHLIKMRKKSAPLQYLRTLTAFIHLAHEVGAH